MDDRDIFYAVVYLFLAFFFYAYGYIFYRLEPPILQVNKKTGVAPSRFRTFLMYLSGLVELILILGVFAAIFIRFS